MSDSIVREMLLQCDVCDEMQTVKIEGYDNNILDEISFISQKIKLCCSHCSVAPKLDERNSHIDQKQLESFKILMSEIVDSRLDAKLEWTHAQNISALLRTFDLQCPELERQLQNPNEAIMDKFAMWVVLPYDTCKSMIDVMSEHITDSSKS